MHTTRLSSKGQIVIPKALREARSWNPGQAFELVEADNGVLLRPSVSFEAVSFDEFEANPLRYDGPPIPVELMNGGHALRIQLQRSRRSSGHAPTEPEAES